MLKRKVYCFHRKNCEQERDLYRPIHRENRLHTVFLVHDFRIPEKYLTFVESILESRGYEAVRTSDKRFRGRGEFPLSAVCSQIINSSFVISFLSSCREAIQWTRPNVAFETGLSITAEKNILFIVKMSSASNPLECCEISDLSQINYIFMPQELPDSIFSAEFQEKQFSNDSKVTRFHEDIENKIDMFEEEIGRYLYSRFEEHHTELTAQLELAKRLGDVKQIREKYCQRRLNWEHFLSKIYRMKGPVYEIYPDIISKFMPLDIVSSKFFHPFDNKSDPNYCALDAKITEFQFLIQKFQCIDIISLRDLDSLCSEDELKYLTDHISSRERLKILKNMEEIIGSSPKYQLLLTREPSMGPSVVIKSFSSQLLPSRENISIRNFRKEEPFRIVPAPDGRMLPFFEQLQARVQISDRKVVLKEISKRRQSLERRL